MSELGMRAATPVVVALMLAGCSSGPTPAERAESADRLAEAIGPAEVMYQVEGTAQTASVTVKTPTGTSQADIALPLRSKAGTIGLRFEFPRGSFVYISAQQRSGGTQVTCRISVDGVSISENSSSGEFQIATCEGSA